MKNLKKLGSALSKPEQKEIFGGKPPPPPPGLCTPWEPCGLPGAGTICCQSRGGSYHCLTPLQCQAL